MKTAFPVIIALVAVCVLMGCGTRCGDLPGTVAVVNGQGVSADEYVQQLTMRMGQDVLRNMIEQKIVLQWAEKAKVAPTDEQINKQIEDLKYEGQYDEQVRIYGEDAVKSELRLIQARMNLAKKYTKITGQDLQAMYDRMRPKFNHGPRKFVAAIISSKKDRIDKAMESIKKGGDFDEVAREYSDRGLIANPPIKTWIAVDQPMPGQPGLDKAVKSTKKGKTSGVITLGPSGGPGSYAVLKVLGEQGPRNSKLAQVKDLVENQVALQNSQMDTDFVKKLNAKMKAAEVKVNIERFKDVAKMVANPPEPTAGMPGQPGPR